MTNNDSNRKISKKLRLTRDDINRTTITVAIIGAFATLWAFGLVDVTAGPGALSLRGFIVLGISVLAVVFFVRRTRHGKNPVQHAPGAQASPPAAGTHNHPTTPLPGQSATNVRLSGSDQRGTRPAGTYTGRPANTGRQASSPEILPGMGPRPQSPQPSRSRATQSDRRGGRPSASNAGRQASSPTVLPGMPQ